MSSETILTGLRANGALHLGSYLGAMQPMVNLQQRLGKTDRLFMFVPDLHSFTMPIEHGSLYSNVIDNVRMYLAAGIDPNHKATTIWRQSRVSAHAELTWVLNCFTYYGEALRMNEFKDKAAKLGNKEISIGLFDYPVLMASDILLYDAQYVPLGDDQKQHMELIRTVAERFNKKFGRVFTVPKPWKEQLEFAQRDVSVRIRSLANPDKKMSKSVEDPRGTINLTDPPAEAAKKILAAQTDSKAKVNLDFDKQPGISNLLQIGALLLGQSVHAYASKRRGLANYGALKQEVADLVASFLTDYQQKLAKISAKSAEQVLEKGEAAAKRIAHTKLQAVYTAIGLSK